MNAKMIALKQQAIANRRGDYYMSSAVEQASVGRVTCIVDFKHRNRNSHQNHVHTRFELNGKRIAGDKLAEVFA